VKISLVLVLALLSTLSAPVVANDFLNDTLGEISPLTKESGDHRVRVTVLYIGPARPYKLHVQQNLAAKAFVVTYLVEDLRSDTELLRHPAKMPEGNIDSQYYLAAVRPDVKDGAHHLLIGGTLNEITYEYAMRPDFKAAYPEAKVPKSDHPDRIWVYEDLFDELPEGPFDLVFHDSIPAYGDNFFHFRDINAAGASSSH